MRQNLSMMILSAARVCRHWLVPMIWMAMASLVQRTFYFQDIRPGHMGVDHGGLQIGAAQQFLDDADVGA